MSNIVINIRWRKYRVKKDFVARTLFLALFFFSLLKIMIIIIITIIILITHVLAPP